MWSKTNGSAKARLAYESGPGAKFGGKSHALLMESTRYLEHARYQGAFSAASIRASKSWCPGLGSHWKGDHRRWSLPSGAQILVSPGRDRSQ